MLPKENRLKLREDFSRVYKNGLYFCQGNIAIKFLKTDENLLKIGFSVGKNYSKLAVRRNRAKRILREATRKHIPKLKTGYSIVIMLRGVEDEASSLNIDDAEKNLESIFLKTNIFK